MPQVPPRFPSVTLPGRGGSMHPTIRPGDQLELIKDASVKLGDLAVYLDAAGLVAHRVIGVDQDHVWTRGDNQSGPGERVPRRALVGKVHRLTRRVTRASGGVPFSKPWWTWAWLHAPGTARLAARVLSLPGRVLEKLAHR